MATKHVANHEAIYVAINSSPDMCIVGGQVVPFEIHQTLNNEKATFATKVFARGQPVLMKGSIIKGVIGNAGQGIVSGVSMSAGNIKVLEGASSVIAEGRSLARHLDPIEMNGSG